MTWMMNRGIRAGWALMLALAAVTLGTVAQDGTELAYDDGTAETSRAFAVAGSGLAVRFTAPAEGGTLVRIRLYVTGLRGGSGPIEVHVWDADRNSLTAPLEVTPNEAGWLEVDLGGIPLTAGQDFYVGYVQLSAEVHPWIGLDTSTTGDSSFTVPDWSPVLPPGSTVMIRAVIEVPTAQAGRSGSELAHDDGTAEAGRGYALAGLGYAVRFTVPEKVLLVAARFYISGFRGEPAPIEIHIWNDKHEDLIAPFQTTPTEGGWFEVDLSGYEIYVDGDFLVGYVQVYADAYPWIGFDLTAPGDRSYTVPSWHPTLPAGSNVMIRVVVGKDEERR